MASIKKKTSETEEAKTGETNPVDTAVSSVNQELDNAKNTFTSVVIIGVKPDGSLDIRTNLTSYELTQYLFHRASFEIFVHQRDSERRTKL